MSRATFPAAVLEQHMAVLGKTGSGKTTTSKLVIEQAVAGGARVCILDPIKSDWWGLTSSADGTRPGLPFHILGGPHGHVPLHSSAGKAVAEIVASGALPLSIVDMAEFEPGGQSRFFVDFAQALLRKMRGVVYLVLEEAHLFAPKERSGIGQENLAIHWAKTLATAGRSKGIRLVLVTQRTQALHNALLGSCDTVIAHRLTAPADQAPVVTWLKANTSKAVLEQVSSSLSSLKTGEGWICAGEARLFERRQFPRIATYDNTATPTGHGQAHEVTTAAVDAEQLRALIGEAVEQAKADDPRELRKQIAEKDRRIKELEKAASGSSPSNEIREVHIPFIPEPVRAQVRDVIATVERFNSEAREALISHGQDVERELGNLSGLLSTIPRTSAQEAVTVEDVRAFGQRFEAAGRTPDPKPAKTPRAARGPASAGLDGSQQNILDVVAMLDTRGIPATRDTVARWLDIHPNGGRYGSNLAHLRASGYLDGFTLTDRGAAAARPMETGLEGAKKPLDGSQVQILDVLDQNPRNRFTRESLAQVLDIHPNGGRYGSNLARLRTMGLIPDRGEIYLTEGARR